MRLILGAPCSGKGTIMDHLCKKHGVISFSAGNILREMCETPEYAHLKQTLAEGNLVATELICEVLLNKAKEYNYNVFFDGFPRTVDQAEEIIKFMKEHNIRINAIFVIQTKPHLLFERTLTRTYCEKCFYTASENKICCGIPMIRRRDDNAETLIKRIQIFEKNINRICLALEGPIYFIDNSGDINDAVNKILGYL